MVGMAVTLAFLDDRDLHVRDFSLSIRQVREGTKKGEALLFL